MKLREWNAHLHGLVVFRALLNDPVVAKLLDLTDRMEAGCSSYGPVCDAVAAFEAALFEYTTNWGSYLSNAVLEAETICVRQAAAGQLDALLQSALDSELQFLQQLCGLTLDELFQTAYSEQAQRPELAFLPRWQTCELDLAAAYAQRMSEVGKKGYGMFAKHHVFTVENGQLVPVKYPDPQRLSELPGYEKEREKVIANTKALLAGMPANNVLLYGDAGTGKSSAVKAIANEFAPEGLRLVGKKEPAVPDSRPDGQAGGKPAQVHPVHRRPELYRQRRQLCRPEGYSGGQRRRTRSEHCGVCHLQPPPPHQGDPLGPHRRRHP